MTSRYRLKFVSDRNNSGGARTNWRFRIKWRWRNTERNKHCASKENGEYVPRVVGLHPKKWKYKYAISTQSNRNFIRMWLDGLVLVISSSINRIWLLLAVFFVVVCTFLQYSFVCLCILWFDRWISQISHEKA